MPPSWPNSKHEDRLVRLKQFWQRVAHRDSIDANAGSDQQRRSNIWLATLDTVLRGVPGFFKPRAFQPVSRRAWPWQAEEASFYDTSALAGTLEELVDFDYLNQPGGMRLTVNALRVTCGSLRSFDNRQQHHHVPTTSAPAALCRPASRPCASMAICTGMAACIRIRRWKPCSTITSTSTRWCSWSTCGAPMAGTDHAR
jgi:hypothetical protein